jgi:DNA-binding NarL/FixJ family response regulator
MKPTVIIVDDHALFRNGLASLLRNTGDYEVIDGAGNGLEMQPILRRSKVDVILMDMVMPVMNGYDAIVYVKKNYPDVKCLALSMYDHNAAVSRALGAGALGYILKSSDILEVKAAIQAVIKDGFYYNDLVNKIILQKVMSGSRSATGALPAFLELNDKEVAIIKMVSQELTTAEIGERLCLSPRTIEGIRIQLAEKLRVRNGIGLVLYGIKAGLIEI